MQSLFSLISPGTEMMKVSEAKMSMVGKARARPDQVRKLMDSVAQQGAVATYRKAMSKLDSYTPLGYSLCGEVLEVGAGAEQQFAVGQLVAAGVTWGLAIVATFIILKVLDATIGLRVTQQQEIQGLDLSQHGEEGYITS